MNQINVLEAIKRIAKGEKVICKKLLPNNEMYVCRIYEKEIMINATDLLYGIWFIDWYTTTGA